MSPKDIGFSVLSPNDSLIKDILKRRYRFAIVLLALHESPCYPSELTQKLGFNVKTINEALGYLENAGLIISPNSINSIKNDRIKVIISAKKQRLCKRLPESTQKSVLKRIKFYILTEKGKTFLDYAVDCVKEIYGVK
jgi:predicted transcriptional regulator